MNDRSRSEAQVITATAPEAGGLPTWLAASLVLSAMVVMWLVSFDNGQLTGLLDSTGSFAHELFHDGRHLLGVPCH